MADPDEGLRVRWRTLAAVLLAVGTVSIVALRWWQQRSGELVMLPALLVALLALIAAVVLVLGLRVRRWVRRGEPIDPLGATRTLVLGQSAACAGAVVAGFAAASTGLALFQWQAPAPRSVALVSGLVLLAALAMTVSGMVTQWCCLVPPSDDGDGDDPTPV